MKVFERQLLNGAPAVGGGRGREGEGRRGEKVEGRGKKN